MLNKNVVGSIDLNYLNSSVDIILESNCVFAEGQIIIENSEFYEIIPIDIENENFYFSAQSISRNIKMEEINTANGENIEPEYTRNIYNDLLYYSTSVNYENFLSEGKNKITVLITLDGTTQKIVNYLENNNKYTYMKVSYQKELQIDCFIWKVLW